MIRSPRRLVRLVFVTPACIAPAAVVAGFGGRSAGLTLCRGGVGRCVPGVTPCR